MKRLLTGSVALCVLLLASALLARPGVLKTKSGDVYKGDITDDGDHYTITADKVQTPVSKQDVESIYYPGPIDDQFNKRLAALDPNDAPGRVKLARFAFANGKNDLAARALNSALQIDPNNQEAQDLLKTVNAQNDMQHKHDADAAGSAAPTDDAPTAPGMASPMAIPKRLLTPADINSIRQHELKPAEDIPISIPPETRRKFAANIGMNYNDFNAMAPADQLALILQKGDAKTKAAVKIARDPQSIMDFKRLIQPMVLRNCATGNCHGGPAGGKFILYNNTDQASTYTNFYIMEQFAMKSTANSGFFGGGGERKLIDRGDGAHSLLVAFGLPAGQGDINHPKIPNTGFNGIFRSRDDRLCQQAIDWMDNGLTLIEPDYGIKYTPPTVVAPTPPTTAPNTTP
jgi:hypothetical protein